MAFINARFTEMQMAVRLTFLIFSILFTVCFSVTICRLPHHIGFSKEQKQILGIAIALILFNDPGYVASIYMPGIFTAVVSQLWVSIFFVLMLKYWLRGVEQVKDEQAAATMLDTMI